MQFVRDTQAKAAMTPKNHISPQAAFAKSNTSIEKESALLWHQRLGHCNMQSIRQLINNNAISG